MTSWVPLALAVLALAVSGVSLRRALLTVKECERLEHKLRNRTRDWQVECVYSWAAMRELDDNGKKRAGNVAETRLKKRGLWDGRRVHWDEPL